MSELINKAENCATFRWKLLTGASALALTAYTISAGLAHAEGADQPLIWIELGGQLSRLGDQSEIFAPNLPAAQPTALWAPVNFAAFTPPQNFAKQPLFGFDEYGKISFQADNSDWLFTASIRYGRSLKDKHVRQQSYPGKLKMNLFYTLPISQARYYSKYPRAGRFADTQARNSEQHTIIDFQAGKDVGLGLFGMNGSSAVNLGVRFAQFRSKSNISLKSDPDWHFQYKYYTYSGIRAHWTVQPYHSNAAGFVAERSFRGVGPTLSWNASVPFAGNSNDGELNIDWSANVALLFGRQRTRTQHQTTVRYNSGGLGLAFGHGTLGTVTQSAPVPHTRSRNVTVPNVGGSVGLSWRLQNFKMSFGYKADFFFNAIDGGIDARKSEDRGFYGPYASISIGLGD